MEPRSHQTVLTVARTVGYDKCATYYSVSNRRIFREDEIRAAVSIDIRR
jgi:hypothetical protein